MTDPTIQPSRNGIALACPDCRAPLDDELACGGCAARYGAVEGIPRLLPGSGATNTTVQAFYSEHPFPDYEDLDSPRALRERAGHSQFMQMLDEQLPLDEPTLEVGCGTGQLTNFLALSRRPAVGLDFCQASLELATGFQRRFDIDHARFYLGDLFHPPFAPESFANVVSLGVLHHTADPAAAFRSVSSLVRPGGHIVVGLYNRYARIATFLRGMLIRTFGKTLLGRLDPVVRKSRGSARRRVSWLNDQYFHPLEKTHTVDEVLGWFDQAGFDYVNAVPKIVFGENFDRGEDLFEPGIAGTRAEHLACQLGWLLTHGWEGGLFVMVGRRR